MLYTADTKHEFDPGKCPECGEKGQVTWMPVKVSWDRTEFFMPGAIRCPNGH